MRVESVKEGVTSSNIVIVEILAYNGVN